MRRREFMAGVLLAAATRRARAQQRATRRRIAIFHPAIPATLITAGGLHGEHFSVSYAAWVIVERENLIIERYSAEGHHERYAGLARDIVTHPGFDRHRN
jgi:putative ABC transport system substrate-binding protein